MDNKKKRKGIEFKNNKKIHLTILLSVILIFTLFTIFQNKNEIIDEPLCFEDNDCVPATCCHPTECIIKEKASNCDDVMCSAVCEGPLDCGAGTCKCINHKCEVVPNE